MRCTLSSRHSGKMSEKNNHRYCLLISTKLRNYLIKTKWFIKINLTQNATEKVDIPMCKAEKSRVLLSSTLTQIHLARLVTFIFPVCQMERVMTV